MKPKKIWANFGLASIERTMAFYLALGFKLNGDPTEEIVSFLFGEDEFVIHFFEKERFKASLEGNLAGMSHGNEIMFSLHVESKTEYDTWVMEIEKVGGTIFFDSNKDRKEFYDRNGYYVCVFSDPDGHKFNLLYGENM